MASSFLYNAIIEICQKQYGANDYDDFPEIILESYPFVRGDQERIRQDISLCFSKLKNAGAELFCVASNSFHGFLPEISQIRFVNLILESLEEASRCKVSKALILGAQTTIDLRLYEQGRILCVYPSEEEQKYIQKIIREVAGGSILVHQAVKLGSIIKTFQEKFLVDGVIIACTELPLIHREFPLSESVDLPILDTVEVLAKRLLVLSQNKGH